MKPTDERVARLRDGLLSRRSAYRVTGMVPSPPHRETLLRMVEDGEAHATRIRAPGSPQWAIHCWPGETDPEFPYRSARAAQAEEDRV